MCLSEPVGPFRHITVAFVTSQIPADLLPTDLVIGASQDGFDQTGLRVASVVRLHRLLTIDAEAVVRTLGEVPEPLRAEIGQRLRLLFGL